MILLAVAAQSLDMLTYTMPGVLEANPIVNALGPVLAVVAKAALMAWLVFLGVRLGHDWRIKVALALAVASGLVGAASNLNIRHA